MAADHRNHSTDVETTRTSSTSVHSPTYISISRNIDWSWRSTRLAIKIARANTVKFFGIGIDEAYCV